MIAAIPLLTLLVMSFDVGSTSDWYWIAFYAFLFQAVVFFETTSTLTTSVVLKQAYLYFSFLASFGMFVLLFQTWVKYQKVSFDFKNCERQREAYLNKRLVQISVSKSFDAKILFSIFLAYNYSIRLLSSNNFISKQSEQALNTTADVLILFTYNSILCSEHIGLEQVLLLTLLLFTCRQ